MLAERCQGKFVPLERPKTLMEIEEEVKEFEEEEVSCLMRLSEQVERTNPSGKGGGDNASSTGQLRSREPSRFSWYVWSPRFTEGPDSKPTLIRFKRGLAWVKFRGEYTYIYIYIYIYGCVRACVRV